jgi:hypothetical protein
MSCEHMSGEPANAAREEADALLRSVAELNVPPLSPAHTKYLRQRVGLRVDQIAVRERSRVVRMRRVLGVAAAAVLAGAAAFGVIAQRTRGHENVAAQVAVLAGSVKIGTGSAARSPGSLALAAVSTGEDLVTGEDGSVRASLVTGTSVQIGPLTRVRFSPTGKLSGPFDDQIVLEYGRIGVEVPRLAPGVSVSVRAADALVTVHGTSFTVERRIASNDDPGETRVAVTGGLVAIRHAGEEVLIGGGQSWASHEQPVRGQAAEQVARTSEEATSPPTGSREPARTASRSTLSAENELLERAIDARRRGQARQALEQLDRLLARYPDSPLTEIARVERMRTLGAMGDSARAAVDARKYLKDYPHGFARTEAASVAGPPP